MAPWLRVAGLMDQVKVSRPTIYRWIGQGLPHRKVGGVVLFDLPEVEAWIRKQRPKGTTPKRTVRRRARA